MSPLPKMRPRFCLGCNGVFQPVTLEQSRCAACRPPAAGAPVPITVRERRRSSPNGKRGRPPLDIEGKRFGRLLVIARSSRVDAYRRHYWRCRCDCGQETEVRATALASKQSMSCGCLRRDVMRELWWDPAASKRMSHGGSTGRRRRVSDQPQRGQKQQQDAEQSADDEPEHRPGVAFIGHHLRFWRLSRAGPTIPSAAQAETAIRRAFRQQGDARE